MIRWFETLGAIVLLAGAVGCTTTKVVQVDLSEVRLMVVGLAAVPENRVKFEDVLVRKLEDAGMAAIASHTWLPDLDQHSRESIGRVARESGATAVIAVTPVRVEDDGTLDASWTRIEQHARLGAFVEWGLKSKTLSAGQVAFATNVYQLSSGRLLWGGVSWPFEFADVDALIEETATVIAANVVEAERQLLRLKGRGIDPVR